MDVRTFLILGMLGLTACEAPAPPKVVHDTGLPALETLVPEARTSEGPAKTLELSESTRYEDCHERFNPQAEPVERLPDDAAMTALGCGMEAYSQLSDGSVVAAYLYPRPDHPHDLRVVRWDAQGTRLWWHDLDRTAEGSSFSINFRASWIADLLPAHVCAGTMWEGGTQGACFTPQSGEPIWSGRMPFWAGMKPMGFEQGLYVPDVSGLTQRYPYSGVEMRYRKFDGSGGRSALYLGTSDRLLFAPSRAEAPRVMAYGLKDFEPLWRLGLPKDPTPNFGLVAQNTAILEIADELWAIDVAQGKPLWRRKAPSERASVAATEDTLFVLERRETLPSRLHAWRLREGESLWVGDVPLGTLSVHTLGSRVFLKSVRSLQELRGEP